MKKLLSMSLVAALAVTPLMAFADPTNSSTDCENAGGTWTPTDPNNNADTVGTCTGYDNTPSEPSSPTNFRVSNATHTASTSTAASGAYVKGAYNANVANINNALEYVEDSTIATINTAKVGASNVALTVTGFTPAGSVSVNTNSATVSGTVSVPTTVEVATTWGSTATTTASLGGSQNVNIANGAVSNITASFSGTASGDLSGTGSFSNASVSVTDWVPVTPSANSGD